jgi:hypothetical protein
MTLKLKSWLVLALIFVAGAVSGAALTLVLAPHFAPPRMRPHDPARMQRDMLAGLTRELKLTADQQSKIQPILADTARQMQEVHHDEVQRISQIFHATGDRLTPILNPDQQATLQKLESQDGARVFFQHAHNWGQPPPPPPGMPPAPPGDAPGQPPPPPPATNAPPQ